MKPGEDGQDGLPAQLQGPEGEAAEAALVTQQEAAEQSLGIVGDGAANRGIQGAEDGVGEVEIGLPDQAEIVVPGTEGNREIWITGNELGAGLCLELGMGYNRAQRVQHPQDWKRLVTRQFLGVCAFVKRTSALSDGCPTNQKSGPSAASDRVLPNKSGLKTVGTGVRPLRAAQEPQRATLY